MIDVDSIESIEPGDILTFDQNLEIYDDLRVSNARILNLAGLEG